jgi:hypothetical protein
LGQGKQQAQGQAADKKGRASDPDRLKAHSLLRYTSPGPLGTRARWTWLALPPNCSPG